MDKFARHAVTCYVFGTSAPRRKSKPKTAQQRMRARRERLRAQGLRPVQHWVPDLRDPKVVADLRRQARLLARPVEGGALDDWIEQAYDWGEWR
jgi:hypothetical protein